MSAVILRKRKIVMCHWHEFLAFIGGKLECLSTSMKVALDEDSSTVLYTVFIQYAAAALRTVPVKG